MAAMLLAIGVPGATAAPPSDPGAFGRSHRPVCGPAPRGAGRCLSEVVTDAQGDPLVTPAPSGYGPADLQSAYGLADQAARPAAQTIAIVDAYDDPNAEADLAVYRSQYGLPPCTTANGCFQQGQPDRRQRAPTRPATPAGHRRSPSTSTWPRRSARTARSCSSRRTPTSFADLAAAVDRAAALGATADLELLRRQRVLAARPRDETPLQPPRRRGHGQLGRQRLRRRVPGGLAVRDRRRRHDAEPQRLRAARLDGDRLVGRGQRLLGVRSPSPPGRPTPAARSAPSPTSPPSPTRTPASRCTTAFQSGGWLVFGGTSAAAPIVAGVYALIGYSAGSPSSLQPHGLLLRRHVGQKQPTARTATSARPGRASTAPPAWGRRRAAAGRRPIRRPARRSRSPRTRLRQVRR